MTHVVLIIAILKGTDLLQKFPKINTIFILHGKLEKHSGDSSTNELHFNWAKIDGTWHIGRLYKGTSSTL